MLTAKTFLNCGLVFAYLLIGSGPFIAPKSKPDARQAAKEFAATIPRKIYKYSVVPGGVNSAEELARARRSDPVVAAHFADFGKNTWMTTLKEDMYVYVSYRQGNSIRYTKTKHKVCKGEVVITDGKNYARARCANRLTKVFRPPALVFDEPSAPQFDYIDPPSVPEVYTGDPVLTSSYDGLPNASGYVPPSQPAQTGANPGPPSPGYGFDNQNPILPSLLPYAAGAPGSLVPQVTPVITPTVPEPAEWPALALGCSCMLGLWLNRRRKTN